MKNALLQIHAAVLLWGFTGVLGKLITLDAPVLVWYRMLMTGLFMAVILFYRKQWVKIEKTDLRTMAKVGCLMGLHWVAFYGSIKLANASIALICLSTASIFTTLIDARMNGKKIDKGEIGIGAIALLGVFLMYIIPAVQNSLSGEKAVDPLPHRDLGILSGVVAAILSSWFTVLNKGIAHKYPARLMVYYEMGTGWVLITLLLPLQFIFLPQTRLAPNWWDLGWLVILSLCCTVWAQSLALNALKHISSFTATLSVNLEPVYGIILAFVFLNEDKEVNTGFFVGMSFILLSVILQTKRLLKPASSSPGYIEERGGIE